MESGLEHTDRTPAGTTRMFASEMGAALHEKSVQGIALRLLMFRLHVEECSVYL